VWIFYAGIGLQQLHYVFPNESHKFEHPQTPTGNYTRFSIIGHLGNNIGFRGNNNRPTLSWGQYKPRRGDTFPPNNSMAPVFLSRLTRAARPVTNTLGHEFSQEELTWV